ncbi:hypothetical protein [Fibrobacter intestinalis]|uniref:Uncharacterized protein n=1 Tax=Fibrobacter intestinalis TaxID=28122 RepID=A0A1T4RTF3_9BACT|nr:MULTISPECIES: hypothetical protein [Fibrobacter]PBC75207.1 hypothetical protein BGW94_2893 [Fibrobacter sp. NR9]SKA19249.1 hypothetical protein SAMN02745108_02840 [Fibrobacter intestinalis]
MKPSLRNPIFLIALLALSANSLLATSQDSVQVIGWEGCKNNPSCLANWSDPEYPDQEDVQDSNFKQHYSPPCGDILEYGGHHWALFALTNALENFFRETKSKPLSGIAGRYKLQDSTLFLTGLDICFNFQEDGDNPIKKFRTKIPLKLLFPGAKDSLAASLVTDYMVYRCLDCQTDDDDTSYVSMGITFDCGKISHIAIHSISPINPVTKKYFPFCKRNYNGKIWYLDNPKEHDIIANDGIRLWKRKDYYFFTYPLDTIQFKGLIDSLSPYYQMHRRNYLDSLAKEKEKQSSE